MKNMIYKTIKTFFFCVIVCFASKVYSMDYLPEKMPVLVEQKKSLPSLVQAPFNTPNPIKINWEIPVTDVKGETFNASLHILREFDLLQGQMEQKSNGRAAIDLSLSENTDATQQNLKRLFSLVKSRNPQQELREFTNAEDIKALFNLERYLSAPKIAYAITQEYAHRFPHESLSKKFDAEKALTQRCILNTFHELKNTFSCLDLSRKNLDNLYGIDHDGILEGINRLDIQILDISDNNLKELDCNLLWQTFPNLLVVNAQNNNIRKVTGGSLIRKNSIIQLQNNQLNGENIPGNTKYDGLVSKIRSGILAFLHHPRTQASIQFAIHGIKNYYIFKALDILTDRPYDYCLNYCDTFKSTQIIEWAENPFAQWQHKPQPVQEAIDSLKTNNLTEEEFLKTLTDYSSEMRNFITNAIYHQQDFNLISHDSNAFLLRLATHALFYGTQVYLTKKIADVINPYFNQTFAQLYPKLIFFCSNQLQTPQFITNNQRPIDSDHAMAHDWD